MMRELSSFGPACMDGGEEDDCDNTSQTLEFSNPWRTLRLVPPERSQARALAQLSYFDTMVSTDGQSLADGIEQEDNFAVKCDNDASSEKFWIVNICDKPLFTCQEDLHDRCVNQFKAGEWLLRGAWYHKRQRNFRTHVLLDKQPPAFCYSHLV